MEQRNHGSAISFALGDPQLFPVPQERDGEFYGGDQGWWLESQPKKERNGCSAVAAANALCYLALTQEEASPLYPYPDVSRNSFLEFMRVMYHVVSPASFGKLSLRGYVKDVLSYCEKQGVPMKVKTLSGWRPVSVCREFLIDALAKNLPVSALNLSLRKDFPFHWHWVTITGLREEGGITTLIASSFGQRVEVGLEEYLAHMHRALLKGGFAVFEPDC